MLADLMNEEEGQRTSGSSFLEIYEHESCLLCMNFHWLNTNAPNATQESPVRSSLISSFDLDFDEGESGREGCCCCCRYSCQLAIWESSGEEFYFVDANPCSFGTFNPTGSRRERLFDFGLKLLESHGTYEMVGGRKGKMMRISA